MPSRLGSADHHVERRCAARSNRRSTRSRAGDGSLCATTGSPATSSIVTCRRLASGCDGGTSSTSSSLPTATSSSPSSADGTSARRNRGCPAAPRPRSAAPARAGRRWRCRGSAARKRAISGSSVWTAASLAPIEHAPAAQVAEFAHRRLGLLGQPDQPLAVVLEHPPGVGQGAALRRAVEQLLAQVVLQPADGLADRGLGPVHLRGGARKAALFGDRQEDLAGRAGP